jgi:hypothetical protein
MDCHRLPLVDRHGAALSQSLARVYGVTWPSEPMHVDLSSSRARSARSQ